MLFEGFNYQSDHSVTCDLETHYYFGHLSTQVTQATQKQDNFCT